VICLSLLALWLLFQGCFDTCWHSSSKPLASTAHRPTWIHTLPRPAPPRSSSSSELLSELDDLGDLRALFAQAPRLPEASADLDLPAEFNMVRPPKYEHLRKNLWVAKKNFKRQHRDDVNVCCCEVEVIALPDGTEVREGCVDGCLNRCMWGVVWGLGLGPGPGPHGMQLNR
jgi:hypothetical protein